jgi:hypothetical protein
VCALVDDLELDVVFGDESFQYVAVGIITCVTPVFVLRI